MGQRRIASWLPGWVGVARRRWGKCSLAALMGAVAVVGIGLILPAQYRATLTAELSPHTMSLNNQDTPLLQSVYNDTRTTVADVPTCRAELNKADLQTQPIRIHTTAVIDRPVQVRLKVVTGNAHEASLILQQAILALNDHVQRRQHDQLLKLRKQQLSQVDGARLLVAKLTQQQQRLLRDNPDVSPDNLAQLRQSLFNNQQQLEEARKRLAALRTDKSPTLAGHKQLADLEAQRAILERDVKVHLERWGRSEDHPLVKKTRGKISQINSEIAVAKAEIANQQSDPEHRKRIQEVATAQEQVDRLSQAVNEGKALLVQLGEFEQLQEELDAASVQLQAYETAFAQLQKHLQQAQAPLTVIDRTPSLAPAIAPTLKQGLIAAGLAALMGYIITAIMIHRVDSTLLTTEQAVQVLSVPVLGSIDRIKSRARLHRAA